jgi:hypothetical protein
LDVGCFGKLKNLWGKKLKELHWNEENVTKHNFLSIYATVREGTFTPSTIHSAFRATGIWPFNPNVIKPHQTAPALEASTEAGAPFPIPPDIRDVVEVLRLRKTTNPGAMDIGDDGQHQNTAEKTAAHLIRVTTGTPIEYVVDPDLPSFSSATPIPAIPPAPPRHQRIHGNMRDQAMEPTVCQSPSKDDLKRRLAVLEDVVDTYEATILLQDGYCRATNRKLYKKETKTKTKRQVLADHGKRDMTHTEWLDALREESTLKDRLATLEKEKRAWRTNEQATRNAENEKIDKVWTEYAAPFKAAHKRPPTKKPAHFKRAETPERFQEILQLKEQISGPAQMADNEDSWLEDGNDEAADE